MPYDLIIFDCDGVLVDSEPLVNRIFVDMLTEVGHVLDRDASLREFSGASMAARIDACRQRFDWTPASEFLSVFHARLKDSSQRELEPVSGVQEIVKELRVPFCVASNGTAEEIRHRLGVTGLLPLFQHALFSASEVARPKPDPALFLHAASRLGASPARCAVVEDSIPGVQAAVFAGMKVFGYARIVDAARLRTAGAITFTRMLDLPALLEAEAPA